jgi:hypothetical protein
MKQKKGIKYQEKFVISRPPCHFPTLLSFPDLIGESRSMLNRGIQSFVLPVILLLFCLTVIMSLPNGAFAATVNLPKTGQTICYDASGNVITCANTWQDGDVQAGAAWPSPRFTDNGNGTVTDNLTGLVWLRNANCANATRSWTTALSDVAQLNTNGTMNGNSCGDTSNGGSHQTDWRLPNVNELESLIHAGQSNTATWLNGQGFSNVQAYWYWSSTTVAGSTGYAWLILMSNGRVGYDYKSVVRYVWPVRAGSGGSFGNSEIWKTGQTTSYAAGDDGALQKGVAWPSPNRFTVGTDALANCVTDNLTGLMWVKSPDSTTRLWQGALDYANTLNLCGYTDWRLPNRKELFSLIHYGQSNTATWLNGQGFSNVQAHWYWSSTTYAVSTDGAWDVGMSGGSVNIGSKAFVFYVWPVRAGSGVMYNLNISKAGTGTGTVTSNPAGVNCGADCTESYESGTSVTLTANPDTGSTVASWSGDCSSCGTNTDCNVTMNADKTCTATFNLIQRILTVTKAGTGSGNATAAGCTLTWSDNTGTCTVDDGTAITLTGTADIGSTFGGWSSGIGSASSCTGTGNCSFNITADSGVTATFTLNQYTITTSANPTAGGSVTCSPNPVNHGSTSTCTVTTNTGYTIQGVGGTCGGTLSGNTYTTSAITANCTVTANFAIKTYTITITQTAGGTIACNPTTVNHGSNSNCTITPNASYIINTVTVNGSSVGAVGTYQFSNVTANQTITATYTYNPPSDPGPGPTPEPPPTTPPTQPVYTPNPPPSDAPPAGNTITNNNPAISYTAGWTSIAQPNSFSGTIMRTHNIGGVDASMQMTFSGSSIHWQAQTSPRGGMARVYINGVYAGTVNLNSVNTENDRTVFSATGLGSGTHTIRIVPMPSLPGFSVNIDRFIVQ